MRQAWLAGVAHPWFSCITGNCFLSGEVSSLPFLFGRSGLVLLAYHAVASAVSWEGMLLRAGCGEGQDPVQQWVFPRTRKFF